MRHAQWQPWADLFGRPSLSARHDLPLDLLVPVNSVFFPADVSEKLDRLFFAVWLVVTVDNALQLVFFLVANLLDVLWQLPQL